MPGARPARHTTACRAARPSGSGLGPARVAPGDCSPEALTRTGLGGFHHPALPLMCPPPEPGTPRLMAMRPRFARESEARAEDIVPTTQRTSARGPLPFRGISGDMSPDVNAPVMGPFESSHQHGPPLLGRVRGPTRSPTSSLICSPPTPSLPSAAASVVPGRWPTLSLVRQGGRRASQVPGPSSSSVPSAQTPLGARLGLPIASRPPSPSGCTMPWAPRMSVLSWLYRGRRKPYGPLACVPTHRRLRYRGRRKARYRCGWVALHRTGFAPVGRRTKFHDVTASSLPFDQPCLVALCTNAP